MVNPIYQQDEELLLNQFGSKYLGVAAHTNVNSNEFIVQEDAVISVLTGGDSSIAANNVDYKASMDLSGVTLKQGALIVAPQGESFQSMTIDSGTIMAYNSVVGGTKPSAVPLLLDLYPDAAAAYSLRKLRTDYTGSAIEVRKTVGGATFIQDIGFVNGELDTTSLLSFAEGGDVFVAKWYDQSGAGNDVAQVSESAQPQIVSSGVVNLLNFNPTVKFNAVSYLDTLIPYPNTTELTTFATGSSNEINSRYLDTRGQGTAGTIIGWTNKWSNIYDVDFSDSGDGGHLKISNVSRIGQSLATCIRELTLLETYTDGLLESLATGTLASFSSENNLRVGNNITTIGTQPFNGDLQEVIIYNANQTANKAGIESNINTHYTIYQ